MRCWAVMCVGLLLAGSGGKEPEGASVRREREGRHRPAMPASSSEDGESASAKARPVRTTKPATGLKATWLRPFVEALESPDAASRLRGARALREIRDARAVQLFIVALNDKEPRVRETAAWALADFGDSRAGDALLPLMTDADPGVRAAAMVALGAMGDKRVVEAAIGAPPKASSRP